VPRKRKAPKPLQAGDEAGDEPGSPEAAGQMPGRPAGAPRAAPPLGPARRGAAGAALPALAGRWAMARAQRASPTNQEPPSPRRTCATSSLSSHSS